MLSRVLGLVRDVAVSSTLGSSVVMEAFLLAYRVPNLFREVMAEGALASAFTKTYTQISEKDPERAKRLLIDFLRIGFLLVLGLAVASPFIGPLFVDLLSWYGQSGSQRDAEFFILANNLSMILMPFLGLAFLGSIAAGVLYQRGNFFTSSIAPLGLNIGMILGVTWFLHLALTLLPPTVDQWADRRAIALSIGVMFGGFFQFYFQFAFFRKSISVLFSKWRAFWKQEDVRKVLFLMLPQATAASLASISILINTNFATSLESGSLTWLNYGFRMFQLPVGVIAVALSSVLLPNLSRLFTNSSNQAVALSKASEKIESAVVFSAIVMFSLTTLYWHSGEHVISIIFGQGAYNSNDVSQTANVLAAYGFGLFGYSLTKIMTPFYYATDRTRFALYGTLLGICINFFAAWKLSAMYQAFGLALATSISLSCNGLFLLLGFVFLGGTLKRKRILTSIFTLSLSLVIFCLLSGWVELSIQDFGFSTSFALLNSKLNAGVSLFTSTLLLVIILAPNFILFKKLYRHTPQA